MGTPKKKLKRSRISRLFYYAEKGGEEERTTNTTKTQRSIIRCLLFTCASNKYGLTDASLNAKEITVASSPASSNRRENREKEEERGQERKEKREKEPVQRRLVEKRYFSDWRENCSTHYSSCIEGKSRFSRSFVRCVRATIYVVISESASNRSGNALAHNRCAIQTRDDNSSRDDEKEEEKKFLACIIR